tara:strand:+ start:52 stop:306 length:255 start_codon:yes stop_codon:yes gene_type:complete
MDEKSQVFYLTVISIGTAFLLALSRQMYKSKCSRIECCGCIIERDTQTEQEIDENPALHQSNDIEEGLKLGDIDLSKIKKPESP